MGIGNKKAKMGVAVPMEFPLDVLAEILSRFCVKSLTRFKSVCKAWLLLISSQEFIQLHLKKSSFRPICLRKSFFIDCPRLFPPPTDDDWEADSRYNKLSLFKHNMVFVGSSFDGLVCLFSEKCGIVHIWNPAIRASACISIKKPTHQITFFWFGHHDNEYKLILGTNAPRMHLIRPYVDRCSWESTKEVGKNYNFFEQIGTLFNSMVHWPVYELLSRANSSDTLLHCTILSYDLCKGSIGQICIPEIVRGIHIPLIYQITEACFSLGEVDGCLSALFTKDCMDSHRPTFIFELWAMKGYGVKESWTKLMVLNCGYITCASAIRPRIKREPVLDNPATLKSPLYSKEVYVESLVSPRPAGSERACRHSSFCCLG